MQKDNCIVKQNDSLQYELVGHLIEEISEDNKQIKNIPVLKTILFSRSFEKKFIMKEFKEDSMFQIRSLVKLVIFTKENAKKTVT